MTRISTKALIFLICSFCSTEIRAQIKADFTISASIGCSPLVENFTNATTGGKGPYTYIWNFGDGDSSTSASPGHIFGYVYSSVSYNVTLYVKDANNDTSSITKTIVVLPTPRPDLGPDQRGCWGHPIMLTTGLLHGSSANWTWILGSDTVSNAFHGDTIYVEDSGIYIVTVKNSYGCMGMDTTNIYFNPLVHANEVDSTVCFGDSVKLRAGIGGPGATYEWIDRIHNNEILSVSPVFSFLAVGSTGYGTNAQLQIVIDQTIHGVTCADTGYYNITVNTPTHQLLSKIPSKCISDPAFLLPGNGTWFYPRNPAAIVNNYLYPAIMGETDKESALGWIHNISANSYKCVTEDSIKIEIYGLPDAHWIMNYSGDSADFQALGGQHESYQWTFGDSATGTDQNIKHLYVNNGNYRVSLTATDSNPGGHCSNTFDTTVNITLAGMALNKADNFSITIYPNPFNSSATIQYQLNKASDINIGLFDITGKFIDQIMNETQTPGLYRMDINAEKYHLMPGVYLLKFITDDGYMSRTIMKL